MHDWKFILETLRKFYGSDKKVAIEMQKRGNYKDLISLRVKLSSLRLGKTDDPKYTDGSIIIQIYNEISNPYIKYNKAEDGD